MQSTIGDIERRINDALDRLQYGIESLPNADQAGFVAPNQQNAGGQTALIAALQAQLDEEKTANSQLEQRVRVIKKRQDVKVAALEEKVEAQRAQIEKMDADMTRLREATAELRDLSAQLREAMGEGQEAPHLVNKAMLAELEALRATRAAETTALNAVLAELSPLMTEED